MFDPPPSQLADPAKTICPNKMRDSGVSGIQVANSGNHSPRASRDDGARKKDKGVGRGWLEQPCP